MADFVKQALLLLICVWEATAQSSGFPTTPPPPQQPNSSATAAAAPPTECRDGTLWRSTALVQHPTANEDFVPESADYWKKTVVSAAWPCLIGLGLAVGLLLVFILWRCLRCCCGACCGCCFCRRKKDGVPFRYVTARWVGCLKVVAAVLVAGLAGGCALVMARIDAKLVNSGLVVVADVKLLASNIINKGRATVAAADGMLGALGEVLGVLDAHVNATDIAAQLQCLSPWLDSLPDPQLLSADLLAVNASIDGTLRPRLTDLSTQLASLAGALEPGAGRYALALEIAGNVSALLLEGPAGLVPRANAFMAAAGALDASAEEPAKMAAVLGALGALLPLDEAMADLAGLQDALATLHAAGTTDGYVPAAVDDLAALRGMAVDVLAITGTVRALQGNHTAAEPCMVALLERAAHINESVLVLASTSDGGLGAKLALLQEAQDALGGLMGSPTGLSSSLANQLEAAVPLGALDAALAQLQDAVNLCSSIASLWPLLDVVADLQAVQASLNATAPQLEGALAAGDQYLALCYPGGGAPAPAWATLVGEVQGAAGEVGDAVAQAPADTSDSDQVPALLALLPELHSSLVEQQGAISDVQALLVSVPDVAPYLSGLAEPAAPYSELPQPPHQLAAAAEADLEALLQGVLMALAGAQSTISEEAWEARGVLADAEEQTVGRLDRYEARWLPIVRKYDGMCANLDAQIITRLPADGAGGLAVARYFLYGQGNLTSALQAALDVPALQRHIEDTRAELLQEIAERYILQPLLAAPVGLAVDLSCAIQAGINELLEMGSREAVYPVYLSAKAFVCCRALDVVGAQWLALLLAGSCGVALCLVAFSCLASLDKLGRLKGWCACYKKRHFADEAPFPLADAAAKNGGKAGAVGGKQATGMAADARAGTPRSSTGAQLIAS